ncbi:MAG TPA: hypothetical protein VK622_14030 [Puia sp.]|nr:hypothetical protein [Puia sp.]
MKQTVIFFCVLGLFIQIISCSKSDPKPNPVVPPVAPIDSTVVPKDTTEDVYIVGQTPTQAGYWKNSRFVPLATRATGRNTYADDMAFSGNDIYVLGTENDSNGYWKNGQFNFLAKYDSLLATSIVVSGTDVYCLLSSAFPNRPGSLFKNTSLMSRVPTHNEPFWTSLYSNGSDLYIPGSVSTFPDNAVYWKNGLVVPLPNTSIPGNVYGIALDGNDVYAVGSESYVLPDSTIGSNLGTYWKNNVPFYLTDSTSNGKILFVTALNSNVCMAGFHIAGNPVQHTGPQTVFVWKNGVTINVTPAGYSDDVWGLAINGSDVYVSVISTPTGTTTEIPRYYKNGVPVNYTATTQGSGTRIFVRPR